MAENCKEYIVRENATEQKRVRELIRCKDCMHWQFRGSNTGECQWWDADTGSKYFCADGERKKENESSDF